jgi:hypothetical protein
MHAIGRNSLCSNYYIAIDFLEDTLISFGWRKQSTVRTIFRNDLHSRISNLLCGSSFTLFGKPLVIRFGPNAGRQEFCHKMRLIARVYSRFLDGELCHV